MIHYIISVSAIVVDRIRGLNSRLKGQAFLIRLQAGDILTSSLSNADQSLLGSNKINDFLKVILHLYNKLHNLNQCGYVLMIIDRIRGPISQLKGHAFLIRRCIIQSIQVENEIESIFLEYSQHIVINHATALMI